jgi:hypothetical protein
VALGVDASGMITHYSRVVEHYEAAHASVPAGASANEAVGRPTEGPSDGGSVPVSDRPNGDATVPTTTSASAPAGAAVGPADSESTQTEREDDNDVEADEEEGPGGEAEADGSQQV